MLTDFFTKRTIKKLFCVIVAAWLAVVMCLAVNVKNRAFVDVNKNFYFLVSTSANIQASAHFVEWNGGAGYLLKTDETEYVVYAVYLHSNDGEMAQASLVDEKSRILSYSVGKVYLHDRKLKGHIEQIKGAFESFYGCLLVLEEGINNLAHNGTQEEIKRVLQILNKQFDFLALSYRKIWPQYAEVCKNGSNEISNILNETIFLKDLRFILCQLCVGYIDFSKDLRI